MLDLHTALSYANQNFLKAGIANTELDARLLLAFILNKSPSNIFSNLDQTLNSKQYKEFIELVSKRSKLEPIAYIIQQKEFYGHDFFVDRNVLIPRPSTELLIDILLKEYKSSLNEELRILDLGTGSGCIIITLLLAFPQAIGVGIDISKEALAIALKNAKTHQVDCRLKLIKSDWFEKIPNQKYDIIVANPPYISENEIDLMAKETLLYEPKHALFASDNGLAAYDIIGISAQSYLKPNGKLIIEIGFNQQQNIIDLFLAHGYKIVETFKDLAGHNRAIIFT